MTFEDIANREVPFALQEHRGRLMVVAGLYGKHASAILPMAHRQAAASGATSTSGSLYKSVMPAERHKAITKKARKTNHIERFNNTLRQRISRLVRGTLSFSKKLANHTGAIKYFICHYNLTKVAASPV